MEHGTIGFIPPPIQDGARDGTVLAPALALEVQVLWNSTWKFNGVTGVIHPLCIVHPDFQPRWSSSCSHKVHSGPIMVSPIVTGELNGIESD
jgi:hypothetical protein